MVKFETAALFVALLPLVGWAAEAADHADGKSPRLRLQVVRTLPEPVIGKSTAGAEKIPGGFEGGNSVKVMVGGKLQCHFFAHSYPTMGWGRSQLDHWVSDDGRTFRHSEVLLPDYEDPATGRKHIFTAPVPFFHEKEERWYLSYGEFVIMIGADWSPNSGTMRCAPSKVAGMAGVAGPYDFSKRCEAVGGGSSKTDRDMTACEFAFELLEKAGVPLLVALTRFFLAGAIVSAEDSLPPLVDGKAPQDLNELWGDYDARKDPLETTVVREWKEGAVTCRYVVFTIGTFKGRVSRIAAFYAFPTGAKEKLPGLLDLHGGGQRASSTVVVFQAQNGYAGLSINWGGNPMEEAKEGEPNTDWGALDATQRHNAHYGTMKPDAKTLDAVESPRNNNWFLLVLAARRGLTFLEQQSEVDAQRLGVAGHSMGGKLTTDLAGIDERVKVAVPSCGGCGSAPGKISGIPGSGMRSEESTLHLGTIDDCAYIPRIRCPILFLSPTNDFAGPLDNMAENWKQIVSKDVRYAISPHFNHRHAAEFSVTQYLYFEQHLKGGPALPETPSLDVKLDEPDGVPAATLRPDRPGEVVRACIYYSVDPHVLTRFWRDAPAKHEGDAWIARCPVMSADQPLYVMASVYYPLKQTFKRYQWLGFDHIKEFAISSTMITQLPADLKKAGVKATDTFEAMIDDFSRKWQDWTRLEWGNPHVWDATTRKIKDPKWRGPDGAQLAIDVKAPEDCTLVIRVRQNDWGAYPSKPGGEYATALPVKGSPDWQTLTFALQDFRPANDGTKGLLANWSYLTELSLRGSAEVLKDDEKIKLGGQAWNEPRQFRNLRWIGGRQPGKAAESGNGAQTQEHLDGQIQKMIKESTEREKRERDGK